MGGWEGATGIIHSRNKMLHYRVSLYYNISLLAI